MDLKITLVVLAMSSAAMADEVTYQFRSVEDVAYPPDDTICAQAPFSVNVKLGASLWSEITRIVDGRVIVEKALRIGRATACVQLTNFLFPPGLQQNFYAVFDLPSGRYTGNGTCTLSSNDVPQAGLVLAGCTLDVISGPNAVIGGVIVSSSVFNPGALSGYSTGSVWSIHAYTSAPVSWWPYPPSHGFQLHEERRSDDEISAARARLGAGHGR